MRGGGGGRVRRRAKGACLDNLGEVGAVDEVADKGEPRAACQADIEPLQVHAHERVVVRFDRRNLLLRVEAALHGAEPAAR